MPKASIEELHRILNDESLVKASLLIEFWEVRDAAVSLALSLDLCEAVECGNVVDQITRVEEVVARYQPAGMSA